MTHPPREGSVSLDMVQRALEYDLKDCLEPNICVTFTRSDGAQAYAVYRSQKKVFSRVPYKDTSLQPPRKEGEIHPKSAEQAFALQLLEDPSIDLVTLMGKAGSGKTLLALFSGLCQVRGGIGHEPRYEKIQIFRPMIELGEKMGYLPGTEREKYEPWTEAIRDQFRVLYPREERRGEGNRCDLLMSQGIIECSPITFVRGRTLHRTFIIIDEAQNLTPHEIKTVCSRAGHNSKLVLTGDPEQIDTPHLDILSNGLVHAVSRARGGAQYGHKSMKISVRSELAKFVAERF